MSEHRKQGQSTKKADRVAQTRQGITKLRFRLLDRIACFRNGINSSKSVATISVNATTLPKDVRNLIADNLKVNDSRDEIDVIGFDGELIGVEGPNLASLVDALRSDAKRKEDELSKAAERVRQCLPELRAMVGRACGENVAQDWEANLIQTGKKAVVFERSNARA